MQATDPYILIYVSRTGPRLQYIFHHLFRHILRIDFRFTHKIEEFVAYNGPKFSYSSKPFGNEFHIHDTGFLFQKGVHPLEISRGQWRHLPVIFHNGQDDEVPFDLFSAAFYLISRYEEYLAYQPDEHGRFPYARSIAQSLGFLDRPMVEQWLHSFMQVFRERFPELRVPEPIFRFRPLINVTLSHLYKHKGIIRFVGGVTDDGLHLRFRKAWERIKYAYFRKKDPYDTFLKFIALQKGTSVPFRFFFLLGMFSPYDHNISPSRPSLRRIIKMISDYSDTGLLISYDAQGHPDRIRRERNLLENLIHRPVEEAHFHYYRNRLPEAYQILSEMEFRHDYTMGYSRIIGYRASTSHPFPFYDLQDETVRDLIIHPVPVNDYQLRFIYKYSPREALNMLKETGNEIRRLGGTFHPVFHNAILSEYGDWKGWSNVFTELINHFSDE